MKKATYITVPAIILGLSVMLAFAPGPAMAASQEGVSKSGVSGGEGVVVRVDQPENCLRIRSGPSMAYSLIGCAKLGEKLRLTGLFSGDGRWAQVDNNGWVYVSQIATDLKPPQTVAKPAKSSVSESKAVESWNYRATTGPVYYGRFHRPFYRSYGPGFYGRWR